MMAQNEPPTKYFRTKFFGRGRFWPCFTSKERKHKEDINVILDRSRPNGRIRRQKNAIDYNISDDECNKGPLLF
jgi:hypothetical protein